MTGKIFVGNAFEILPTLEQNSVHCCVGSPPYYSLRKYQGDQQCDWPEIEYLPISGLPPIIIEAMTCALGYEESVEAYIGHLVAIYRKIRRVLREDGCAWIVMGDSFCSQGGPEPMQTKWRVEGASDGQKEGKSRNIISGLQAGDLMMVPHRLALALQADGWIVRNDVVWQKVAPMPESVSGWRWERCKVKIKSGRPPAEQNHLPENGQRESGLRGNRYSDVQNQPNAVWVDCPSCPKCEPNDGYVLKRGSWRHTRAHEFVFMMAKKMQYFANQEAAREGNQVYVRRAGSDGGPSGQDGRRALGFEQRDTITVGRNPRSVISPKPENFPGPHFAVFPSSLIKSLIEATCPARCCPECGQGWAPIVKRGLTAHDGDTKSLYPEKSTAKRLALLRQAARERGQEYQNMNTVIGYRPTCLCGHENHIPGTVLDPFLGSGTTGLVADRLGLNFIGIELSQEYAQMARKRIEGDAPMFANVEVVNG